MNLTPCPRCREAAFDLNLTEHGLCKKCQDRVHVERWRLAGHIADMKSWDMLTPAQAASLRSRVMGTKPSLTADGHPIVVGGRYVDYDLRECIVTGIESLNPDARERDGASIWWRTTTGMFDGTRLVVKVPR